MLHSLRSPKILAFASAALLAGCMESSLPTNHNADAEQLAVGLSVSAGTYSFQDVNAGKCADVSGGSLSNGAQIIQWTCKGSANQQWKLNDLGSSWFTVVSVNSGECLDLAAGSTLDGAKIEQWGCNGGNNQKWKFTATGTGYEIVSAASNKCLDVKGSSSTDGTIIQQWTCNGNTNQQFKANAVGGTTPPPPPPSGSPSASQLLSLMSSCNKIGGYYATDDGASSTVPICKVNGAVWWKADMDIDCDGVSTSTCNSNTDPWFQNQTSFTTSTGNWLNSASLPYYVVPLPSSRFDYTKNGIQAGQVAAVIFNGKIEYAVFGDEGPSNIIGEASVATANALGIPSNPATGGSDGPVWYMVFTGSSGVANPIENHSTAVSVGTARANWVISNN